MPSNARDKFWRKAITEAGKRIKVLPDGKLNTNLDYACGSLAEAYNVGVQEAQMEICDRLKILQEKLAKQSPALTSPEGRS